MGNRRWLAAVLVLGGCGKDFVVEPPATSMAPAAVMPLAEARQRVKAGLAWCDGCEVVGTRFTSTAALIKIRRTYEIQRGVVGTVRVPFDQPITRYSCQSDICYANPWPASSVTELGDLPPEQLGLWYRRWALIAAEDGHQQRTFDAFNVLVAANKNPAQAEEEFRDRAATWRAASPKPALSAEGNRHRVLAEAAFREKNTDAAIEHYEAALEADPTWPGGNFNLALLQGESGDYAAAARHMKRYLLLVPEAKDARAASEKVMVWEDKAGAKH